jgi:hypothetical protein
MLNGAQTPLRGSYSTDIKGSEVSRLTRLMLEFMVSIQGRCEQ